jgi:hypothetical protein
VIEDCGFLDKRKITEYQMDSKLQDKIEFRYYCNHDNAIHIQCRFYGDSEKCPLLNKND